MTTIRLPSLIVALLGAATLLHASAARAQAYPSRNIVIVAPVPPGGTLDFFARLFGDELQKRWGRPVVIENRAGAGGLIGAEYVARSQPDGHTLLVANDSVLATPNFVNSKFDGTRDLTSIALVTNASHAFFASTQLPAKSIAELIAYAKANPGRLNVAYLQQSLPYLEVVRFMKMHGLDVNMVPYSGNAPVIRALLANEVQLFMGSPAGLIEQARAGKMAMLAVTGAERLPAMPDVPTVKSTGIDFETRVWHGLFGPAGIPREIVAKLSIELTDIAKQPETQAKIRAQGYEPRAIGNADFTPFVAQQMKEAADAARAAGVQKQ